MRPNFFAFDALAYALQAGITQIPLFLRRGWLGMLIIFSALAYFLTKMSVFGEGFGDPEFADFFYRMFSEFVSAFDGHDGEGPYDGMNEEDIEVLGAVFLFYGATLFGGILAIPGFVDIFRVAAKREPSPGFLPTFGKAEWYLIIAYVLVVILTILFFLIVGGLAAILTAGAVAIDMPWLGAIPITAAVIAVIWFGIRTALIPIHAALTESIAFGEAFNLVRGRAWKFLGTSILYSIILGMLTIGLQYVGTAGDLLVFFGSSLIISVLVGLYQYVSQSALYGRIAADLLGMTAEDEEDALEEAVETAGDVVDEIIAPMETADASEVLAEEPLTADAAAKPTPSFGQPMKRRDPGFVPRRLR
ncbi:MAG: hypothetical protein AAF830_12635 [Pseudomonadota bacterium]